MSAIWRAMALGLAWCVGGCAFVDSYNTRALSYNVEARRSQDAGLLLNIVRSMYRHPLQYTAITTTTGSATAGGQATVTIPFGIDAAKAYSVIPSLSGNATAQFQVSVLDTEEFIKGILQPMTLETLDYYVQQQFPRGILYLLLFDRIEEIGTDGSRKEYDNFPPSAEKFGEFLQLINAFWDAHLITEGIKTLRPIGPPLSQTDLKSAETLVKVEQAGLKLQEIKERPGFFQLVKEESDYRFCFRDKTPATVSDSAYCGEKPLEARSIPKTADDIKTFRIPASLRLPAYARADAPKSAKRNPADAMAIKPNAKYVVYTRSVEGIIYYLGEVLRGQMAGKMDVMVPVERRDNVPLAEKEQGTNRLMVPLFKVHSPAIETALTQVSYFGQTYSISAGDSQISGTDRTTQVLALLTNLLAMNKSAKNLPATNVFTLIGR